MLLHTFSFGAEELSHGVKIIFLSKEENERLCSPWKHSLIIKLLGKKLSHQYLRQKLMDLWKLPETFPLIDLGLDFYVAKFSQKWSVVY